MFVKQIPRGRIPVRAKHLAKSFYVDLGMSGLEPVTQGGKTTYLAHGKVDFFGDEAMARTGGVGGPICTVRPYRFSLPLAA